MVETLIVGLGNPGRRFAGNRHNVGFQCLRYWAKVHGWKFNHRRGGAEITLGELAGHLIALARPRSFVNLSGQVVARLVKEYELPLTALLVVYDDLDLPLGRLRLRPRGGAGGHQGMASIIQELGSADFPRLRVGIGRPEEGEDVVTWVLGDFSVAEKKVVAGMYPLVAQAIECFVEEGLETAMNRFNALEVGEASP